MDERKRDLDSLIGRDVPRAERVRLERVHDLLVAVGPLRPAPSIRRAGPLVVREHTAVRELREHDQAQAFWLRSPGYGEIRPVALPEPGPGDVVVRTIRSGISRGTEALVFRGGVPASERARMRAPFQEGEFPGPVKYGYLSVGAVEDGPPELCGRTVFCLYPHQTAYVVPAGAVSIVPDDVPPGRAVLAGTVETAVNALWDAAPLVGDRVAVVGAGMVGCCVARLLHLFPRVQVTLVDVDPARAAVASALGVDFALPGEAEGDRDLVVHTSATSAGLQRSLELLAPEGTVLDLSWYGDAEVRLSLGGAFHASRLTIRSSQVGTLSPARAARRTTAERLAIALDLLRDAAFDALLTGESHFAELPEVMAQVADGSLPTLCHTITYGEA
jgi:threonine dehydrogenase-like Zn-dependent dehydrogenase